MFNLTRQERSVLVFLSIIVFFGLGLNFLLKKFPQSEKFYNKNILSQDRININKAGAKELSGIPYIGPATAQNIIQYRSQNGNFKNISELKSIKGLNQKKINLIKDFIFIDEADKG